MQILYCSRTGLGNLNSSFVCRPYIKRAQTTFDEPVLVLSVSLSRWIWSIYCELSSSVGFPAEFFFCTFYVIPLDPEFQMWSISIWRALWHHFCLTVFSACQCVCCTISEESSSVCASSCSFIRFLATATKLSVTVSLLCSVWKSSFSLYFGCTSFLTLKPILHGSMNRVALDTWIARDLYERVSKPFVCGRIIHLISHVLGRICPCPQASLVLTEPDVRTRCLVRSLRSHPFTNEWPCTCLSPATSTVS